MKKNFMKLLEILEFSDEAKKIFITNEVCRFNAIKNPEDLLRKIHMISRGSIWDKKRTIEKFYEETWDKKFYDLDDLLKLWVKKKGKGDMDSEIDFIKYHETLNLFLKLIPLTDENNILKTEYQYQKEQNIIRQTMYDYYRKRTLNMSDSYLQEFQEVKLFLEKLGQMIDLVNDDNLGKMQKELLMDKFAEYMDEFLEICDWFIGDSQEFLERCSEKDKCIHDIEDFQKLWGGNDYHK